MPDCNATITANGPTTFCQGGIVTLSAPIVSGYTYQWFLNGAAISGAIQSAYNVTVNGSFNVRITSATCGPTMSAPSVVTVYPKPGAFISAGGPTSFCAGGSVVLTSSTGEGYTFQWNKDGVPIAGATNVSYTATTSGNYTVTIFLGLCQNTSGVSTVTAIPPPTAQVTPAGSTTFCNGDSVVLNATTGNWTYQWQKGQVNIAGATNSSYTATTAGNYRVITKVGNCSVVSNTVAVTVLAAGGPGATITPAGPTTFCSGGSVVLNANTGGGYTYIWYKNGIVIGGETTSSYTASTSGNYTVGVSAGSCQSNSAAVTVTVNTAPSATITPASPTTFCSGGSVLLNANTGTNYTYQWYKDSVAISGETNPSYTATTSGSYTVDVAIGSCVGTSSATVVTVVSTTTPVITAGGPTTFNSGGSVTLSSNAGSGNQWYKNGIAINGSVATTLIVTTGGSYTVTATTSGCESAASNAIVVTVIPVNEILVSVKTFLQGAYSSALGRHKNITAAWAAVMNANALTQPYNTEAFGYTGTESVTAGFFTATGTAADIIDWVLLEVRDSTTPSTVIQRRAAFIRCDGKIVDTDGSSDVLFQYLANGSYYLVVRHRNHLGIRSATTRSLASGTPAVYDFTTSQSQAYQDGSITSNAAMKEVSTGVFGMWGGNANGYSLVGSTTVRASGPLSVNDYLFLVTTTLSGSVTTILSNVYSPADMNLDGTVRASGPLSVNDYLFLLTTVLGGDATKIISEHQ